MSSRAPCPNAGLGAQVPQFAAGPDTLEREETLFIRKSQVYVFLLSAVACLFPGLGPATVLGQTVPSAAADAKPTPPDHPITLEQLRALSEEIHTLEPMRKSTLEAAEEQRKTLPVWFPPAVWDDIEKKMMAIDLPAVMLPVYQRYVSAETADALILFYKGPIGEQLGQHFSARAQASEKSGTTGAAASESAVNEMLHSKSDMELATARMNELSPEDQARVAAAKQAIGDSWKREGDELSVVFDDYVNNLIQSEIRRHNPELVAAKTAYLRKNSSAPQAQH